MQIRKTTEADLFKIDRIYVQARVYMKTHGNPTQWGDTRPPLAAIIDDVVNENSHVIEDEEGEIVAVFSLVFGEDPTYAVIEDGAWLNDEPYAVIHKVASSGKCKGIMDAILEYSFSQINNIRIDTHADNKTMQNAILKHGFKRCGIIYVDDGTPRIAYQKTI